MNAALRLAAGLLLIALQAAGQETPAPPPPATGAEAPNASLAPEVLRDFATLPEKVRALLTSALALTEQRLTYVYASADPAKGGMDCSGFIYHVLRTNGFEEVPRQANQQYAWVRKAGTFRAVLSKSATSFELEELRPGDLLFWAGTYDAKRDPPVTHTMIYLGREKSGRRPVMVGSSDGRSYRGKRRWGVSVFDFKAGAANRESGPRFVGYGRIPGMSEE